MTPSLPSNHPDYARANRLAKLFNITIEEYDHLLAYQRGVCAICGNPPKVGGNRLSVDHHHGTGLIRGLVDWRCNKFLGYLETVSKSVGVTPLQLAMALCEFLANPPAVTALGAPRYGRIGRTTNKVRRTKSTRKKTTRPKKTS